MYPLCNDNKESVVVYNMMGWSDCKDKTMKMC